MPRPVLALLLLLPTCGPSLEEQQEHYQQAVRRAERRATFVAVGSGLRLGMDSAQVRHHLDSLRVHGQLNWRLSLGPVTTTYAPDYTHGRLVELTLLLAASGQPGALAHQELQRALSQAYGYQHYPHWVSSQQQQLSWFKRGTEIELTPLPNEGYQIRYIDRHQLYLITR